MIPFCRNPSWLDWSKFLTTGPQCACSGLCLPLWSHCFLLTGLLFVLWFHAEVFVLASFFSQKYYSVLSTILSSAPNRSYLKWHHPISMPSGKAELCSPKTWQWLQTGKGYVLLVPYATGGWDPWSMMSSPQAEGESAIWNKASQPCQRKRWLWKSWNDNRIWPEKDTHCAHDWSVAKTSDEVPRSHGKLGRAIQEMFFRQVGLMAISLIILFAKCFSSLRDKRCMYPSLTERFLNHSETTEALFKIFDLCIFILCIWEFCSHVSVPHVCSGHRGQKKMSDPWEMES